MYYYCRVCCLKETEAMITSLKPGWFLLLGRLAAKMNRILYGRAVILISKRLP